MANSADRVLAYLYNGTTHPTDEQQAWCKLVLMTLSAYYTGADVYANPAREVVRRLAAIYPQQSPAMAFMLWQLGDVANRLDPRK